LSVPPHVQLLTHLISAAHTAHTLFPTKGLKAEAPPLLKTKYQNH